MIVFDKDLEYRFTADDAFLYVITMTDYGKYNWRIPTFVEWVDNSEVPYGAWHNNHMEHAWNRDDVETDYPLWPVRDDD